MNDSVVDDDLRAGVVIPIRSFALGKARLADALDDDTRAALARRLADRVVDACAPHRVVVVSSAADVVAWANQRTLDIAADPGSLDAAAEVGRAHLHRRGCGRVVVAHADLPRVESFDPVIEVDDDVVVVVPCQRNDGTPVLSIPAALAFPFSYGPGSAARHVAGASEAGVRVEVRHDPALGFDIDLPEDLDLVGAGDDLLAAPGAVRSYRVV